MTKPILIIDPGHGGTDPGGGSSIFYDDNGWYEKDFVLDISMYQYKRFKALGVPVAITRTNDVTLSSTVRTSKVKSSGAKYCISNHINAAGNANASGVETIHSLKDSDKLARALYNVIVSEGMPGRRVLTREGNGGLDYYFMHRETGNVETVIVEYGFATNAADTELLNHNWQRYAEAVVKAFCKFIEHPYKAPLQLPVIKDIVMVDVEGERFDGYLIDNRTYVPVRFVSEALGAKVRWDQANKTAWISK